MKTWLKKISDRNPDRSALPDGNTNRHTSRNNKKYVVRAACKRDKTV